MLSLSYCGYALALRTGELEEGLRILKEQESLYAGRTHREGLDVLQISYGGLAMILKAMGQALVTREGGV